MTRQMLVQKDGRFEGIIGYGGIVEKDVTRNALVAGTYWPHNYHSTMQKLEAWDQTQGWDQHRVGIYGPDTITTQSTIDTNLTFGTNDQLVQNTDFWRRISVSGKRVTFRNCVFRGSLTENNAMVTSSAANCEDLTFEDCTFAPYAPQQSTTGWKGLAQGPKGTRFIRCDFFGAGDLMGNSGVWDKMTIQQCSFHDQAYFAPDVGAQGGIDDNATHTDCIQWTGGNLDMIGNSILAFYDGRYASNRPPVQFIVPEDRADKVYMSNRTLHIGGNKYYDRVGYMTNTSAMMISPNRRPLENVNILKNYIDGGAMPFNLGVYKTAGAFNIGDNVIGPNRRDNGPTYGTTAYRYRIAIATLELQGVINQYNNRAADNLSYVIPQSMLYERG